MAFFSTYKAAYVKCFLVILCRQNSKSQKNDNAPYFLFSNLLINRKTISYQQFINKMLIKLRKLTRFLQILWITFP